MLEDFIAETSKKVADGALDAVNAQRLIAFARRISASAACGP
jgi:hypothetical protein